MKYAAFLQFGINGCESVEIIEADSEQGAYDTCYEMTIEHAQSYGFEQDLEHFGDNDTLGSEWNEELEEYQQEACVDCYVEEYDPERHDDYLV